MEIKNMVENNPFEEIEEYVIQNTNLTITEPYMGSINIFGRIGALTSIDLTIEFVGSELYECYGSIFYQGYDANPMNILGIRKFVKSEKEVINLIDKSISVSNKLINTVCQLEKEVND